MGSMRENWKKKKIYIYILKKVQKVNIHMAHHCHASCTNMSRRQWTREASTTTAAELGFQDKNIKIFFWKNLQIWIRDIYIIYIYIYLHKHVNFVCEYSIYMYILIKKIFLNVRKKINFLHQTKMYSLL